LATLWSCGGTFRLACLWTETLASPRRSVPIDYPNNGTEDLKGQPNRAVLPVLSQRNLGNSGRSRNRESGNCFPGIERTLFHVLMKLNPAGPTFPTCKGRILRTHFFSRPN
jgi:hypothetical protein